ncbi:MAG: 2-oxoacid:ferredoxin oxidoreductase subunit beta [Candidatus Caenarcaniphilales bacterium]|nr:2-oxoacid:ferredoxin oxidoreductase subunit beta [Candidatus Caenarcaniphilales bacterium]
MPDTTDREITVKDFKGHINPDWCPGCGDFGVLNVLQRSLAEMNIAPEEVMIVSGIGCSSNLPGFINTYGMHTLHGRSLPIAQGFKLANHGMHVIACGGDGDGLGIGVGHLIHSMRRNVDMTYIIMDNSIYGLTTGQTSPTSGFNMKTKSTPFGNPELPVNPMALAISAGCSFVARGFSGNPKQLVEIYKAAIKHKGFAFIDTFSPCVTFNKVNTAQYYRENTYDIQEDGHDSSDMQAAFARAMEDGKIGTGIFYQKERPTYEEPEKETFDIPLVDQPLGVDEKLANELNAQFL